MCSRRYNSRSRLQDPAQFRERAAQVNDDPYSLARVTRVALYGSMLRPEVELLNAGSMARRSAIGAPAGRP
jgi:hypothetical protein